MLVNVQTILFNLAKANCDFQPFLSTPFWHVTVDIKAYTEVFTCGSIGTGLLTKCPLSAFWEKNERGEGAYDLFCPLNVFMYTSEFSTVVTLNELKALICIGMNNWDLGSNIL